MKQDKVDEATSDFEAVVRMSVDEENVGLAQTQLSKIEAETG